MADIFSCSPDEVVFTSGGTEANNMALRGAACALKDKGRHIITTAVEHHSVLKTAEALERDGFEVTIVPVDAQGVIDPRSVIDAMRDDTILVSVMHANNETGALQPVEETGRAVRKRGVLFHTDAVQAFGKIKLGTVFDYADMVTLAAHKVYGPRGAGALLVRRGTALAPIMTGGHHEQGLRPGTENLAAIAGFAAAAQQAAVRACCRDCAHCGHCATVLKSMLLGTIPDICINSRAAQRVPNTSSVSFCRD